MNIFSRKNLPNILTFSRGIFAVLMAFSFFFQVENFAIWALFFFLLASFTDFLDGFLSRKWKTVSVIGTVFDSLFDKILVLSAFFFLFPLLPQFFWIFLLLFWREILIDGIKNFLLSQEIPVSSVFLGKLKMVFQIVFISFCLLLVQWNFLIFQVLAWVFGVFSVIFSLWSGKIYSQKFWHFVSQQ